MLHVISALVVGAVIGYVTNYIAIKMVFRPHNPIMIGRFHVPFTPGIVPKRKNALADILGRAVVDKFFNADDLEIIFKSDTMADAFANSIVSLINDKNLIIGDAQFVLNGTDRGVYKRFKDELCIRIQAAMLRADLPELLTREVFKIIENRAGLSRFGKAISDELLPSLVKPLSEKLENFILYKSRAVIMPILDDELKELSTDRIADIISAVFPEKAVLHEAAREMHKQFMFQCVRPIVESIDVGGMITEKVKKMSPGEIEGLVLAVVNRELRYIVLLGALLGMMIGAINIFI